MDKQYIIETCRERSKEISKYKKWTDKDVLNMYYASCIIENGRFMISTTALAKIAFDVRTPPSKAAEYKSLLIGVRDGVKAIEASEHDALKYFDNKGLRGLIQKWIFKLNSLIVKLEAKQKEYLTNDKI